MSTTRALSLWTAGMHRLRKHRPAMLAFRALLVIYAAAFLADFLGPYREGQSNRAKFYHPPTPIQWFDENGRLTRPYVYNYVPSGPLASRYTPCPDDGKYYIKLFHRGQPYRFLWLFPAEVRLVGVDSPAVLYLLGGDRLGRDILSRVLHGGRISLFASLVGVALSTGLGLLWGGIAGYCGGVMDYALMRLAEVVQSVPHLYLLIALGGMLPASWPSSLRFLLTVLVLSCVGWARVARIVRGIVLSLSRRGFVEAARASGAGSTRILVKHILPNALSYVAARVSLQVPGFILSESSLSFVGLGVQEPAASWGNMLSDAMNVMAVSQAPWILAPGAALFLTVLCWSVLGEGLRDMFDPRTIIA